MATLPIQSAMDDRFAAGMEAFATGMEAFAVGQQRVCEENVTPLFAVALNVGRCHMRIHHLRLTLECYDLQTSQIVVKTVPEDFFEDAMLERFVELEKNSNLILQMNSK